MTATSDYLNRPIRDLQQVLHDRVIADNQDAGNWPASLDPYDEIARQEAIYSAAKNILDNAEATLTKLAHLSQDHRSCVNADQEDWPLIITEHFSDMAGDTFANLLEAINRAKREVQGGY